MQPPDYNKKGCRLVGKIFELKITLTRHVTIYDAKQHLRFHNLLLLTVSQSFSVLYKMDQVLDHPLYFFL